MAKQPPQHPPIPRPPQAAAPTSATFVRTVLSLGRTLNKHVVAEGIETSEQLQRLKELGTPIGQGYLLSRPLNPIQVKELFMAPTVTPA